jgi:phospho-N-acetylmuramoyl-pentapeptide-transferase
LVSLGTTRTCIGIYGDTGSLTIGGIISSYCAVRKELLIPTVCGVLVENLSVVLQVSYFKYTKKRFGEGKKNL